MKKRIQLSNEDKKLLWRKVKQDAFKQGSSDSDDVDRVSFRMFLTQAETMGLSPFGGYIFPTLHWSKDLRCYTVTSVVSIDGYRALAARSGEYAGGPPPLYDEGLSQYDHIQSGRNGITTCTATVRRVVRGRVYEIQHSIAWSEYFDSRSYMWKSNPYMMIGKTAEAGVLRKAFPDYIGQVYTDIEMEGRELRAPEDLTMRSQPVEESTSRTTAPVPNVPEAPDPEEDREPQESAGASEEPQEERKPSTNPTPPANESVDEETGEINPREAPVAGDEDWARLQEHVDSIDDVFTEEERADIMSELPDTVTKKRLYRYLNQVIAKAKKRRESGVVHE